MNRTLARWRAILLGTCALALLIGVWQALTVAFGEGPDPGQNERALRFSLARAGAVPGGDTPEAPVRSDATVLQPPVELDRPLPTLIDVRNPPRLSEARFLPSGERVQPATGQTVSADRARMLKLALEENARHR